MYCTFCGARQESEESRCVNCGSLPFTRPDPIRASADVVVSASQTGGTATGAAVSPQLADSALGEITTSVLDKGAGNWRYIWLTLVVLMLGVSMGGAAFSLFSSLGNSPDNGGEAIGRGLISWIVMILAAKSTWRGIQKREANDSFRQRHWRFQLILSLVFVSLVLCGVGFGIWNSGRIEKANRIQKIIDDNSDLQAKAADFRRRLGEIRQRETPTFGDYYRQCQELEALLNDVAPLQERGRKMIFNLRDAVGNDEKTSKLVNTTFELLEKDTELLNALRREIQYSHTLITLQGRQQTEYYSSKIIPLQHDENRLLDEEKSLARKLQGSGVTMLPE